MRPFFLGVVVGIIIGAVGAMLYCEWSRAPDEALIMHAAADGE